MKLRINIRHELRWLAVLIVIFGLIAFRERSKRDIGVRNINVEIVNNEENYFLEESDIHKLMEVDRQNLIGVSISALSLKTLEERIKRDPFIKDAEIYSDLKGNITARVELRRPVVRLTRNDGTDGYVAEDGTIMPVSDRFTARVMLMTGKYVGKLLVNNHISDDPNGAA